MRDIQRIGAAVTFREQMRMMRRAWRKHGFYIGPYVPEWEMTAKVWRRLEREWAPEAAA